MGAQHTQIVDQQYMNEFKIQYVNLQQTPFVDRRGNKHNGMIFQLNPQYAFNQLPQLMQKIQFKVYKNFKKPQNQNSFKLSNQNDDKAIQEIITQIKNQNKLEFFAENSKKFIDLATKHKDLIIKQARQLNPKCYLLFLKLNSKQTHAIIKTQQIIQVAQNTKYPLLMLELVSNLSKLLGIKPKIFQNNQEFYYKKGHQFLQYLFSIGMPQAFLVKGVFSIISQQPIKAYQMFKNADILGYRPISHRYISQLFLTGYKEIPPNFGIADKYLQSAIKLGAIVRPQFQNFIDIIQKQKQNQQKKSLLIKSTPDTQASQIANFMFNKMTQKQDDKFYKVSNTNNISNYESYSIVSQRKQFYVVFSPLMNLPARHFLARDPLTKSIQFISIYNWDKIDPNKLKLLHEVGTKVVLNNYIRKYGSNDGLPIYRVEDPYTVQIYPRTQKHSISNAQFRDFAKNLFQRNFIDQAFILYRYLVMIKADQLEIVYSNMGLIAQKKNKLQSAVKFYQKSLEIKPYQKSQIRLCNIYIKQEKYDKAKKIISRITSAEQKQKLLALMQQNKKKGQQINDFSKIIKKSHKILKKIRQNQMNKNLNSYSGTPVNLRQDKYYFIQSKQIFSQQLALPLTLSNDQYIQRLQSIYDKVSLSQLSKLNVQNFYKFSSKVYEIRKLKYPYSYHYSYSIHGQLLINHARFGSQAVGYISLRQNFLENRLQEMAIQYEKQGQYKNAQSIYRYSGKNCIPFNIKICELLFLQQQHQSCLNYSTQLIQYIKGHSIQIFFTYLIEAIQFKIKSLTKLNKLKQAVSTGQQLLSHILQKNPKLLCLDQKNIASISFNAGLNIFDKKKTNKLIIDDDVSPLQTHLSEGYMYLNKIYKQIALGLISLKDIQRANQYIKKLGNNKKQKNFADKELQQYYQIKYLKVIIKKHENSHKAIQLANDLIKQITKQKKMQNKQSFIKSLVKQKLSLQIKMNNIKQVIKISQQIVQTDIINLIFIKQKLFKFIISNKNKSISILKLINKSQSLQTLWEELVLEIYYYFQNNRKTQTKNICASNQGITQQAKEKDSDLQQYLLQNKFEIDKFQYEEFQDQIQQTKSQTENYPQLQPTNQYQYQSYINDQIRQNLREQQFQQIQNINYDNQICRFKQPNGIQYIVQFQEKMKNSLEVSELRKFITASDHLCKTAKGSNGIKIFGDKIRLKIRIAARLTGKLIIDKNYPKIRFCYFNQRQGHDDYKRKGKK